MREVLRNPMILRLGVIYFLLKPIRYVLDSHHHGDHAYGNAIFGKAARIYEPWQASC